MTTTDPTRRLEITRLGLSERTVQYHLNSVYNKTAANSRAEATAAAFKRGWL